MPTHPPTQHKTIGLARGGINCSVFIRTQNKRRKRRRRRRRQQRQEPFVGFTQQARSQSVTQSLSHWISRTKPTMKTTTVKTMTTALATTTSSRRKNLPVIVCLVGIVVTLCFTVLLSTSSIIVEHQRTSLRKQGQKTEIQESAERRRRRRRRLTSSAQNARNSRKIIQATENFNEEETHDHSSSSHTDLPIDLLVNPILPLPSVSSVSSLPSSSSSSSSNVLVLVMSHVDHIVQRQMIRETWASTVDSTTANSAMVNVVFVIGSVSSSKNYDVSTFNEEQEQHQDLLEIPIMENYDQLPEKLIQAYSWIDQINHDRSSFDWVAKVDDDVFVDLGLLHNYFQKYNPNIPMLVGNLVAYSKVQIDGKWKDDEFLQSGRRNNNDGDDDDNGKSNSSNSNTHYPYWAKGSSGHVISRRALDYIVRSSTSLHRYQGEDTSLGIWLDEGAKNGLLEDMTYIHAPKMFLSVEEDDDENDNDPTTRERSVEHAHHHNEHLRGLDRYKNAIVIGHNLGTNDLQEIWNHRRQSRRRDERHSGRGTNHLQNRYGTVWIGDQADEFETTVEREQYVEQTTEIIRNALLVSSSSKSRRRQ